MALAGCRHSAVLRYGFAQGTVPQADLGVLVKNMPFAAGRNLFITAALVLFSLFKLFVALHSKNSGRKIVSVLMIAMSILACSLVADKFLIFIAFCLLIYISFEYSCGLRTKIVFTKLLTVVELAVIGYIVTHIVLDAECRLHLYEALCRFSFPVSQRL